MPILFLLLLGASSQAFAAAPSFVPILGAVVFQGLIVAVLAVAILGLALVMAKRGSKALLSFIGRVTGSEQVNVRGYGAWDKDVYDEAMRDLHRHYRAGGIMDRESRAELAHWQLQHPDEIGRRSHRRSESHYSGLRVDGEKVHVRDYDD